MNRTEPMSILTTNNYLSIVTGALITDILVIILLIQGCINSKVLIKWYKTYNLSAVIADVLIIVIGVLLARGFYPYVYGANSSFSLLKFTMLAVCIQIAHDLLFNGVITAIPLGANRMVDTFKAYANEVGIKAIVSDSAMMIVTCLIANYFANKDPGITIVAFIVSVYCVPYLIYTW
jgi:hypothetical protein